MANPGTPAHNIPPGEDEQVRTLADLKRQARENAAARSLEAATIGSGGLTVVDGFIDLQGGSTLHVSGDAVFDGTVTLAAGALNTSGGSISAGVDLTAGRDVVAGRNVGAVQDIAAGRDITATRNITAGGDISAAGGLAANDLIVTGDMSSGGDLTAAGNVTAAGVVVATASRAHVVTGAYAEAWIDGDGTLGILPSSKRFKRDIVTWEPEIERLLQLQAVMFRYTFVAPDAPRQIGFIAEELRDLGFIEFLSYAPNGELEGINYSRLTTALLVLGQQQEARLQRIAERMAIVDT
ncbi:tail fiber domain-containing protein [Herbiconiux sp. P17]|uniref:tail fiber domain-containing protein n=1 Tax=Herbiconiux wuyangfengii TaxID=3342794 RepID=UPI0035BB101F